MGFLMYVRCMGGGKNYPPYLTFDRMVQNIWFLVHDWHTRPSFQKCNEIWPKTNIFDDVSTFVSKNLVFWFSNDFYENFFDNFSNWTIHPSAQFWGNVNDAVCSKVIAVCCSHIWRLQSHSTILMGWIE